MTSHILVLGATGKSFDGLYWHIIVDHFLGQSGLDFCSAALQEGHTLTLYLRNPDKLPADIANNANVSVIKGTFDDVSGLERAAACGASVFISFAGPTANSKGTVRLHLPSQSSIPLFFFLFFFGSIKSRKLTKTNSLSPMR